MFSFSLNGPFMDGFSVSKCEPEEFNYFTSHNGKKSTIKSALSTFKWMLNNEENIMSLWNVLYREKDNVLEMEKLFKRAESGEMLVKDTMDHIELTISKIGEHARVSFNLTIEKCIAFRRIFLIIKDKALDNIF